MRRRSTADVINLVAYNVAILIWLGYALAKSAARAAGHRIVHFASLGEEPGRSAESRRKTIR